MKFGRISSKNLVSYLLIILFLFLIGFHLRKYLTKSSIEGLTGNSGESTTTTGSGSTSTTTTTTAPHGGSISNTNAKTNNNIVGGFNF